MMLESIFFVGHFGVKLQCRLGLKRLDPKSTESFDFQARWLTYVIYIQKFDYLDFEVSELDKAIWNPKIDCISTATTYP